MDTNKMRDISREQFESEFVQEMCRRGGEGFRPTVLYSLSQKKPDGDYQNITESLAWWAWQASREAVVVELPKFEDYPASMERDMRESLRSSIEAQGMKVAP
ncbi:hypothetical protein A3L25_018535 [Pseudomonas putida]|mgnify:CR=1 FL=1|uniref:Uncharacterized protein n=1 Tax=Pseudomonas putida TaxID=303 RepID=A0AAP9N1D7_PSEPU|nr:MULTISPECIES: hypothetical protein [Pseudomonas]MBH3383938.1 hypothetical protein [Pseudomonas juntendi]QJQ11334.1 hypothetical protein A3L25_018535 [Pseudomonas putida]